MIDNSCIRLEDHKEYNVVDKILSDGNTYIYLSNKEDENDKEKNQITKTTTAKIANTVEQMNECVI